MDVRNLNQDKADAAVAQHNKLRVDVARTALRLVLHTGAVPATIPAVNPADLPASTNAMVDAYAAHIASAYSSTTNTGAHRSADSTNVVSAPVATNLGTSITRANELKGDLNAHILVSAIHVTSSAAAVSAADATDAPSLETLLLDIASVLSAHAGDAFASEKITIVAA